MGGLEGLDADWIKGCTLMDVEVKTEQCMMEWC